MPSIGSLYYTLGIRDLTDADLQKINRKLERAGGDLRLTPKLIKSVNDLIPRGLKVELDPVLNKIKDEALTKAAEGKVMKVEIAPLVTNLRKSLKDAFAGNPAEIEVGAQETKLRNVINQVLNRHGFMININTVDDNYTKVVQQKLNGRTYTVKIHADAREIANSVQASLMQVQSRTFGLQVSKDILRQSIDNALMGKPFNIQIAVMHDQARRAVQNALNNARMVGKDDALAFQRLQTGELKAAQAELARLKAAHIEARDAAKAHASASVNLGGALGSNIKIAGELGAAMASLYSIHAAKQFLSQVVEIGGELEHQKIALETIYGSQSKMESLYGQIKGLARQSPFGVMELTKNIKQLSAYGVAYNEVYDTAKRLADISAATSVDIQRLILAYGKTKNRTFLDGLEAKQFAYANIPIYDALSKKLTELEGKFVSVKDVMGRIKKREIGFDMVKEILWDMTDAGGKFYNMQEKLAGSVKTSWKLVRDNIELMFGEIAEGKVGGALKWLAEVLQGLTREWKTLSSVVGWGAAAFGVYKIAVLASNAVAGQSVAVAAKQHVALKMQRFHANLAAQSYRKLTQAEEENYLASSGLAKIKGINILRSKALNLSEVDALMTKKLLTKEDVLRLVALKKLTVADAEYALVTKGMTAADIAETKAQIARAAAAKKSTVALMQMKAGLAGIASSLWSFAKVSLPLVAIGALVSWIAKYHENIKKAKDATDSFTKKGRDGFEDLINQSKELNSIDPSRLSAPQLSSRIEEMKTTLKDYSLTAQETFDKVFSTTNNGKIRSQQEQFEMLRDAVNETAEAYRNMKNGNKSVLFTSDATKDLGKAAKKAGNAAVDAADSRDNLTNISNQLDEIFTKIEVLKKDAGHSNWLTDKQATEELQKQLAAVETTDEKLRVLSSNINSVGTTNIGRVSNELEEYLVNLQLQKQKEKDFNDKINALLQKRKTYFKELYKDNWNPQTNQRQAEEYLQEIKAIAEASENLSASQKDLLMDKAYESIGKLSPRLREMREEVEKMVKTMQVAPDQFGLSKELLEYIKLVERIRALPQEQQSQIIAEYEKLDPVKYVLLSDDVAADSERYMNQIKESLIKSASEKYPELSDYIRKMIESDEFTAFVQLKLQNGWQDSFIQQVHNLAEWQQNLLIAAVPSNEIRDEIVKALGGTETVSEAAEALRKLRKEADVVIQNEGAILLKIRPTLDLSQPINPNLFSNEDPLVQQAAQTVSNAINKKIASESALNAYGLPLTDPTKDKGSKGSQKDKIAEDLKQRFKDIKDAWSEFQKWSKTEGRDAAANRIGESGLFSTLSKDRIPKTVEEYRALVTELEDELRKAGIKGHSQRESLLNDLLKQLLDIDKTVVDEQLKLALDKVSKEAERQLADWSLFEKIRKATGNQELAMSVAFGMNATAETDYPTMIKKQFDEVAKAANSALIFDKATPELLKEAPDEVQKAWEDATKKLQQYAREQKDAIADILNEYQSLTDKLDKIDADRAEKLRIVDESTMPEQKKTQLKQRINVEADYQKFQQSNDYLRFFNDIYGLTLSEANKIGDLIQLNLNQKLQAGLITIYDYEKEMEKVRKQLEILRNVKGNAMTYLTGGMKGLFDKRLNEEEGKLANNEEYQKALQEQIAAQNALNKAKEEGNEEAIRAAEEQLKLANQSVKAFTKIRDAIIKDQAKMQNIADVAGIVANIAGGISDAFNTIREMADALGFDTDNSVWNTVGAVMDTLTTVTSGVSNIVQSLLKGDIGGVIGGVFDTILTPVTIWSKLHDKELQKQIEKSQEVVDNLQRAYDAIERRMTNFLGNPKFSLVPGLQRDYKRLDDLVRKQSKVRGAYAQRLTEGKIGKEIATLRERKKAYNEGGTYGYQRQLMTEQLAEMEKQKADMEAMKKKDPKAIADMEAQIDEMTVKIREFAMETAKDLYGIDLKDWASQLGDALFDAWKKGEDGAEAFKKKAGEILGSVMNNVLKISLLEPMMEDLQTYLFGKDGKSGAFGKDFELTPDELDGIAVKLMKGMEGVDAYNSALDKLEKVLKEKYGLSMKDTDTDKSGMTAGLQSLTEDTGDLLASYVNAIRSDVSLIRINWDKLMQDTLPQMSVIAEAQLTAQRQIAENTLRNAIAAEMIHQSTEDINRLLIRATQGGVKFYVH